MDQIQKVLVKMGRKDLAQQYYEKVAKNTKKANIQSKINAIKEALKEDKTISATRREMVADLLGEYSKFNFEEMQNLKVKMSELLTNPEFATKMSEILAKLKDVDETILEEVQTLRKDFFDYINSDKTIARTNFLTKLKGFMVNLTDEELKTLYSIENDLASLVTRHV